MIKVYLSKCDLLSVTGNFPHTEGGDPARTMKGDTTIYWVWIWIKTNNVNRTANMAATKEKYNALLQFSKMKLEDISQTTQAKEGEIEDIQLGYTRVCRLIDKLEKAVDETAQQMLDEEQSLEIIKQWTVEQKQQLKEFREVRTDVKQALERSREQDEEKQLQ